MFSLYVHIPYCTAICPYCDFNVFATTPRPEGRYVDALLREMNAAAGEDDWRGAELSTIYLGGGTPSLFAPESVGRVLRRARELWPLAADAEVTLEATPESVDAERLSLYRAAGANRLSLGLESMQPRLLEKLGRLHRAEDNLRAVAAARAAGFHNLSIDLIFAVPGETLPDWEADLDSVEALSPEHVSAYGLTYEERTPYFAWRARGEITPASEDDEEAMFRLARERLPRLGFEPYEISNFARPGYHSRHNRNYWNGTSYLGLGAGAHSYSGRGWGQRWSNERNHLRYMLAVEESGAARTGLEQLSAEQAISEFVFLGLRQSAGLETERFARRFGTAFEERFPRVGELCAEGLLEPTPHGYRLGLRGLLLADSVFAQFA